jgi:HlyD family secretion protein
MDDLTGQLAVLEKQVEANNTQKASVDAEMQVYMSKKQTLREQIARCEVKSPMDGTLLQKYAMEGELAAMGKPLAKIADLKHHEAEGICERITAGQSQDRPGMQGQDR